MRLPRQRWQEGPVHVGECPRGGCSEGGGEGVGGGGDGVRVSGDGDRDVRGGKGLGLTPVPAVPLTTLCNTTADSTHNTVTGVTVFTGSCNLIGQYTDL